MITPSPDTEPLWPDFALTSGDMRPHWEGDLVNIYSTILPLPEAAATEEFALASARSLAHWLLDSRARFNPNDRFQIVIGWPKSVRPSNRQIVKTGGTWEEVAAIAPGKQDLSMWGNWRAGVFGE